jgi:hypothetical protein
MSNFCLFIEIDRGFLELPYVRIKPRIDESFRRDPVESTQKARIAIRSSLGSRLHVASAEASEYY